MTMTKKQAFQIIDYLRNIYELKFDEKKLNIWIDLLSEEGDYKPTFKAVKDYITSGNPYPPKIPNILRKEPKMLKETKLDQQTKEHRWKMENDEEYKKKRQQALEVFKKKVAEFNRGDDNAE